MPDPVVFDPGSGNYLVIDGKIVERDALRIAEKIQDYDPALELICLDDGQLEAIHDAPFLVIRDRGNGVYERVLEAWELDDRIIERIWLADGARNNPLDELVKREKAIKKAKDDADAEERGRNTELMAAAMKNDKTTYTFENPHTNELTKIHDDLGVISPTSPKHFV